MHHTTHVIGGLALALALACPGCSSRPDAALSSPAKAALPEGKATLPEGTTALKMAYERGPWRLAPASELDRTVLWISHILIRHAESDPESSPLRSFAWSPEPASSRSLEAARQLAQRVAAMARDKPQSFEQLAAQHSEDEVSRARGGSLGAMSASSLPAFFLDAAQELTPGQISAVVQTALGFHVLLLRSPPPEERVSGQRIVIRYQGTRGHGESTRSRARALALAQQVLREAQGGTAPFDALVAKYSEGDDRAIGGEMGVWSTREPAPEPVAVEALAELSVGATSSSLVESRSGFQILKRTDAREQPELAADAVYFGFDPSSPASRQEAQRAAEELIAAARSRASSFDAHSELHSVRWRWGKHDGAMTAAVRKLAHGELTDTPIELSIAYAVARRATVEGACEPRSLTYELPSPRVAPLSVLDEFVQASQPAQLLFSLGALGELIQPQLTPEEAPRVTRAFGELGDALRGADAPQARLDAYRTTLRSLSRSLGGARYAFVTGIIQRWVSGEMMSIHRP